MVSLRGLVQALLFCMILFVVAIPRPLAIPPSQSENSLSEVRMRSSLTQFIGHMFHKPQALVTRIVDTAFSEAHKAHISPLLVLGIIAQESSFSPEAKSFYGAQGLMQVVPRMHPERVRKLLHPAKLLHPESNIATGTGILESYIRSAGGNVDRALGRYSGNATDYANRVQGYAHQFDVAMLSTSPRGNFVENN